MPTLIELMKDPSVVVRDTTAWTVGRICEMLPEAAINDIYLAPLLQCLMEGLSAEPRVASNVCWVRQPRCHGVCVKGLVTRGMQLLFIYVNRCTYSLNIYILKSTHGLVISTHNCLLTVSYLKSVALVGKNKGRNGF